MTARRHRVSVAACLLVGLLVLSPGAALADQTESGNRVCPANQTGKTQAKFNDFGMALGPGAASGTFWNYEDGLWHIKQVWGRDGGGHWEALGDPYLNAADTYAFCTQQ